MDIIFILVEPAVPANVGAAARAIKTMGFTQLRLVNPCDYLSTEALMLAHGSHDILHNAKVYHSLPHALVGIDFSIATSAKERWVKQNAIDSAELISFIEHKGSSITSLAMVFGGEESGLSNEQIALCDRVTAITLANPYPSLNLSQAVMLFAHILSPLAISIAPQSAGQPQLKATENHGFAALKSRVSHLLSNIGITEQHLAHGRIMERLGEIGIEDVNLLHTIAAKIEEKLKG